MPAVPPGPGISRRIELSVIQNHCMMANSARQESRKNFMGFVDAM
jgi:hypothetical protein